MINRIEKSLKNDSHYIREFKPPIKVGDINMIRIHFGKSYYNPDNYRVNYFFVYNLGNLKYTSSIDNNIDKKQIKESILKINKFKICLYCFNISENECKCEKGFSDDYYFRSMLDIKNEDVCSVCLEEITDLSEAASFMNCKKHFYHLKCLSKCQKAECPMCKTHGHAILYKQKHLHLLNCYNCDMCNQEREDYHEDYEEEQNEDQ